MNAWRDFVDGLEPRVRFAVRTVALLVLVFVVTRLGAHDSVITATAVSLVVTAVAVGLQARHARSWPWREPPLHE